MASEKFSLQGCRMVTAYTGDDAEYQAEYEACVAKAKASSAVDNVFFPSFMR